MFKRIEVEETETISFSFEGHVLEARADDTVASALLFAGERHFRNTPISSSRRGPFCMMGVCFDCLVEIDGVPNRQACMEPVREGMVVRRQRGAIGVGIE